FFAFFNDSKQSSQTRFSTSIERRDSSSTTGVEADSKYCALNFAFRVAGLLSHNSHVPRPGVRLCIRSIINPYLSIISPFRPVEYSNSSITLMLRNT
ncbi:MAG: hypothetical protein ABSD41_08585, partial [Candidatus Bathyarchaeia archaeon]